MSQRAYILLIAVALFIFLYILKKALKKEISEIDAIIWLLISFLGLIFVSVPGSIDSLVTLTGIHSGPIAFLGFIIIFLIIQNIKLVKKIYLVKKKQIKLTQEVALLEYKVNQHLKDLGKENENE